MIRNVDSHCSIMWGRAIDFPVSHKGVEFEALCEKIRIQLNLGQLVFPQQVHGVAGFFWGKDFDSTDSLSMREYDGDFIITDKKNVGIGVLTADCLPIVFYFPQEKIIAAVHVGWRGNVGNIIAHMFEKLNSYLKVDVSQARVFFGPAAKVCCYQVSDDFMEHIKHFSFKDELIIKRNEKLFFDNTKLAVEQLKGLGINVDQIDMSMHQCTMCCHGFHSYRNTENKDLYKTQGSIVWLKL